ncbi:tetratricopeptide repeat protein [Niveispirillum cyanobacteriorum]|uniref:Uncharacterized protein n=1 Tax=Niveispirillum cyanobacteriorum TaxID=1612173 RepID=A0A2K9NHK1_9PROT|nr:tetratricopeptide repeat protein [Niveispirillum cyanobacteriorum]AUN32046.1 hypothetical protein C0V82_16615 [Niveispirillum cyanobacteriorum]GGE73709.1 hypothetical protein GCM10011317_33530 [Niveispirillum cyanobacteriorum]
MDVNSAIDQAIARHQAGDWAGAEAAYRDILVVAPALADIHYLMGMSCLSQGKASAAVKALRTAVRMKNGRGDWWHNLGIALRQSGDPAAARQAFATAITQLDANPAQQAEALAEQGALLASTDPQEAEALLRRALVLVPGLPSAAGNLAAVLFNRCTDDGFLNRPEAVSLLTEAHRLAPASTVIANRLGLALLRGERHQEALALFDSVLSREPDNSTALLARSDVLSILGCFEEAAAAARHAAVVGSSGRAGPLVALGVALHGQGYLDDARQAFDAAIAIDRDNLPAHLNLGTLLRDLGDDEGTERCYQRSLQLAPSMPVVHWQRAQARLIAGDFVEGWQEYEWRWGMPGFSLSAVLRALPIWDGSGLSLGSILLVHAEQGHGDSLQFVRYLPLLRARGLKVLLQVQPALVRLFRESLPSDIDVERLGSPVPETVSCRCPLLGLPLRLGTRNLADIPVQVPYLSALSDRRGLWRQRLRDLPGLRVGLVWAGDSREGDPRAAATDKRRSLSLSQLSPLSTLPGLTFVSLQKGPKASQAAQAPFPLYDWTDELTDFADTAALVSELDLVIGVDTAVIHLSAALARPTWVLSRFDGCWRWLRHRADNPWYPDLRLFRQTQWADWRGVIAELVNALVLSPPKRPD